MRTVEVLSEDSLHQVFTYLTINGVTPNLLLSSLCSPFVKFSVLLIRSFEEYRPNELRRKLIP